MGMRPAAADIDEYIAGFPKPIQSKLNEIRLTIAKVAPGSEEAIKYAIPTFCLCRKNLVHFAAFTEHISFFPTSSAIAKFKRELSKYSCARGTVRFPLDSKIPLPLIKKIVRFRVAEVIATAKPKPRPKKKRA